MNKKFIPKSGQTDYTNIRRAPVINCVVKFRDKILLVKRAGTLNFYPGFWNGVSGFLDDKKSIDDKVKEELREELGIRAEHIISIKQGKTFEQEEAKYNKTWIVHPILVEVDTNVIKLDWEAQEYQWVGLAETKKFKLLPGFGHVLRNLFE